MAQQSGPGRRRRNNNNNNNNNNHHRDNGSRDSRDDIPFKSGLDSLPRRPPPPVDNYRSSNRSDAYPRDGDSRYNDSRPRDYDHRFPPPPAQFQADTYRPEPPRGEFTFRLDKPSGMQELPADNFRPQDRNYRPRDRGGRGGRGGRGRGGFSSWRPFRPSERELLSTSHATGSDVALYNTDDGVKFRPVDQLTDSEEAEMDISGNEDEGAEPSHKRTRLSRDQSGADGDSVPKWSNPDPYSALPPEDSGANNKQRDVLHLIRKARVLPPGGARSSLPVEAADFIACDSSDESDHEVDVFAHTNSTPRIQASSAPGALTGPSTGARQGAEIRGPASALPQAPQEAQAKPIQALPSGPGYVPLVRNNPTLGSRKRTHDDIIKPNVKLGKPTEPRIDRHGMIQIVQPWVPRSDEDQTPWMVADHSDCRLGGEWLHKEIVDFYDYIRPRDFEDRIRSEVVQDLRGFCRRMWRDADIYPFGSFPTGLYLPTSDMDLVVLSDRWLNDRGPKQYDTKKMFWKFGRTLEQSGMVHDREIEFIAHARVPLVKFVDSRTRLKVDISFENKGGVQAVQTFLAWKQQYPAMPILATMVKHLLCMRGLNEPVNGGIGGFSVICLVVSMLQQMPEVQSGSMEPMHHLGELFMRFLDLYGNRFDYESVAISLNPPKYIPKNKVDTFTYRVGSSRNRLSIIDPNDPANDIAGGSSKFDDVAATFRQAFTALQNSMANAIRNPTPGISLLQPVFGANYSSFRHQRGHLENLAFPRR